MRTLGVVTVARSDYGIYLPMLKKIQADGDLWLQLIVSGMHLSPEFGLTVDEIEADGFEISERIENVLSSDSPEGIAKSIGLGTIGFAQMYSRWRPDILIVTGDRYEMYAAALAALPFNIPIAHIHGGELTLGAIDDALRHSITKLSHLHFVATSQYGKRVAQLGEEPWRIMVSGAPSLDNLDTVRLLSRDALEAKYGVPIPDAPVLVTFHPVTLEYEQAEWQAAELLAALEVCNMPAVFTMPNADTNGRLIHRMFIEYVDRHPKSVMVDNLGTEGYFSLMDIASAMLGNSSSGIIEALSFHLPVVNIGNRQAGRTRGPNVIDVDHTRTEILEGIRMAIQPDFRRDLLEVDNPYSCGQASDKIIERLKYVALDDRLMKKEFCDLST